MAKRKSILNAALKALLAGVQTSAWIKIPATFISAIASLPEDKRDALNAASAEKFAELLTQAQLSTTNAALAAVGTEQIKVLVSNLTSLSADRLNALKKLTQQQYEEMQSELHAIHADTQEIKSDVKKLLDKPDSPGSEIALKVLVDTSNRLGRSEKENEQLRETVNHLEEQLAQSQALTGPGEQQVPQPTQQAKDLAAQIEDDAGPYAQALKAIAQGNAEKADELLNETQQFLDHVQQKKDEAQAKIYMARMQNAYYAGRPQDALQYCDKLRPLAGNDSLILNEMAVVYYANAEYKEAGPLMERALNIDEASLGKDHPKVAIFLNNLAQLYQMTNRLKEAEPLMERALNIDEASLGSEHPNVARALNNLALLYKATNRFKEAEPLMERALKIDEASFGEDHSDVAVDLNNLAQLYKATNRLKEAEPLMKRALNIDESSLGKDHPDVARDLNNLAQLYQATNRLKEAEPLMKRALKIDEASFGKDHLDIAIDLNNLAGLYQVTNRLKEAEPLYKRVVTIFEKSLGPDHPNVATALNNLAGLYQDTNRLKEAEPLMERALNIDEASLGKDHPKVARDLNNLAQLYQDTDRLKEAEPLMERALNIDEASFGKDHPTVARDLNNLARLYEATNRLKEAEPLMERHLVIFLQFTRRTGHPHPHLEDAINNYGVLLMQMGCSKDEVLARLKRLAPEMFD